MYERCASTPVPKNWLASPGRGTFFLTSKIFKMSKHHNTQKILKTVIKRGYGPHGKHLVVEVALDFSCAYGTNITGK